jgi:Domain of unknown function (DUF4411)
MNRYLLDANIFIQAKNLQYGFDFCPAFWDWIEVKSKTGLVGSIEKVGDELYSFGDELSDWAKKMGTAFFVAPHQPVIQALTDVGLWATSQKYAPSASSAFMQAADCWLVACALADRATVVTHEIPGGGSIKKIKIPDACVGLKVKCVTVYELLRLEKARFVLAAS